MKFVIRKIMVIFALVPLFSLASLYSSDLIAKGEHPRGEHHGEEMHHPMNQNAAHHGEVNRAAENRASFNRGADAGAAEGAAAGSAASGGGYDNDQTQPIIQPVQYVPVQVPPQTPSK